MRIFLNSAMVGSGYILFSFNSVRQQRTRNAQTLELAYELHFMEKSGLREVRVDVEMDGGESCDAGVTQTEQAAMSDFRVLADVLDLANLDLYVRLVWRPEVGRALFKKTPSVWLGA